VPWGAKYGRHAYGNTDDICSTSESTKLWFGCWRVSCRLYALHCRRDEAGSPQTPTKVQALDGPVTCLRHGDWGHDISIRSASSKLPQVSLYEAQLVLVRLRRDQPEVKVICERPGDKTYEGLVSSCSVVWGRFAKMMMNQVQCAVLERFDVWSKSRPAF
jgi:hypothetical protein